MILNEKSNEAFPFVNLQSKVLTAIVCTLKNSNRLLLDKSILHSLIVKHSC